MSSGNSETSSLKEVGGSRWRPLWWWILAFLFLILGLRLAWVASKTETGWEVIGRQWRDVTIGLIVGEREPIGNREPIEQADFWLRETARIVAADPKNAELAMGAALLLDSPGVNFLVRYYKSSNGTASFQYGPSIDNDAVTVAVERFEQKCHQACADYAAKATQLQPKEVRWWRLRAMLLIPCNAWGKGHEPRTSNWPDVLNECSLHDPENALYDYLAAWLHFMKGADLDDIDMPVVNQAEFDLGLTFLHRGLKKRFCAVGGDQSPLMLMVIDRSTMPRGDYVSTMSGSIGYRRDCFLTDLLRVQCSLAKRQEKSGHVPEALTTLRQLRQYADQFDVASDGSLLFDQFVATMHMAGLEQLQSMMERHPKAGSAKVLRHIKVEAFAAEQNKKTLTEADRRLVAEREPRNKSVMFATSMLVVVSLGATFILFIGGICISIMTSRWHRSCKSFNDKWDIVAQVLAWLAGYAISFAAIGMLPVRIVSTIFPDRLHGIPYDQYQEPIVKVYGFWAWAMTQWANCYGHYIAIGLSLAFLILWHRIHYGWTGLLHYLGRSMLVAASVCLLVYLGLAPTAVRSCDTMYQTRMAYFRNPQAYCEALKEKIREVRAEADKMKDPPKSKTSGGS